MNIESDWNDKASSVKVTKGCTLKLYQNANKGNLLYNLSNDDEFLSEYNDRVTSLSCTCSKGKFQLIC